MVSRTGYTGEDGFEIYLPAAEAAELWERIMEAGGEDIGPAGLGARDTLRFEAKLPLYGQELGPDITPWKPFWVTLSSWTAAILSAGMPC